MIGVRVPFRISLCGGGSDLPAFYRRQQGCVISTTINQFMYIFLHPFFDGRTQVKYSLTELVEDISKIKHPIVRVVLEDFGCSGVDINSIADIPAGTGLGSSSAFTVALLLAVKTYAGEHVSKGWLAEEACRIEIDRLGEPIGKQDAYASAHGGLNFLAFNSDDSVDVRPIVITKHIRRALEDHLMLFYLGDSRSANSILKNQAASLTIDEKKFRMTAAIADLARDFTESLIRGDFMSCGKILAENWTLKKQLSNGISNPSIDGYYERAINAGALGGKLLGAGGTGFLALLCEPNLQDQVRSALTPLREKHFAFETGGAQIIHYEG